MRTNVRLLWVLMACALPGGMARGQDAMGKVAAGADRDLKAAIGELAAVRQKIADEQLPLAQHLSRSESLLREAKERAEKISRELDGKTLDIANAKALLKSKEQEATYVRSLLDEYFRNFEQSVTAAEAPLYRASLQQAVHAHEGANLKAAEAFLVQLAFVKQTVERLRKSQGGTSFKGRAVDPEGNVKEGTFTVVGPMAVFGAADGTSAGVVTRKKPSNEPAIVPLKQKGLTQAIRDLTASGSGLMPVDPTLGGALNRLLHDNSVTYYFKKGGPIMWPILACLIVALAVVIERLVFLQYESARRNTGAVDRIFEHVGQGAFQAAAGIARNTGDFVARAVGYALEHRGPTYEQALQKAIATEIHRYTRGMVVLDTIITAAPLLGLLGTVTGMMASFGLLGESELGAPTAITGGIAEALIATACGLGIAILCLFPYNFLNRRSELARHELEDAGAHLSLLLKRHDERQRGLPGTATATTDQGPVFPAGPALSPAMG